MNEKIGSLIGILFILAVLFFVIFIVLGGLVNVFPTEYTSISMFIRGSLMSVFGNPPSVSLLFVNFAELDAVPNTIQSSIPWKDPGINFKIDLNIKGIRSASCSPVYQVNINGENRDFCIDEDNDVFLNASAYYSGASVLLSDFRTLMSRCSQASAMNFFGRDLSLNPLLYLQDRNPMLCGSLFVNNNGMSIKNLLYDLSYERLIGKFSIKPEQVRFCLNLNCDKSALVCLPEFALRTFDSDVINAAADLTCTSQQIDSALSSGFNQVYVSYLDDNRQYAEGSSNVCGALLKKSKSYSNIVTDSLVVCFR